MSNVLLNISKLSIDGIVDESRSRIVNEVSLNLKKGEVLGLIGESGAGKSTLGLAAMGYTRDGCEIVEGSIEFDGVDLVNCSDNERKDLMGSRIAYVAQSAAASFNPSHRIINQYTEAPIFHGKSSRRDAEADAIQLYNRLRLPQPDLIGFRYPHQVSGGQLQRAMTAMAMSCRPDLIIFDEPTTALDVTTQIEVLSSIRDIVEQFATAAIYITHDLAVVAQMADRIKVLLRGNEVEENTTRQMLKAPRESYTKSLWAVRSFQRKQKSLAKAEATPVISVQNVTAAYGKNEPVVRNVSFDIHAGRTVAVVGESGSGKSTAARCITGLLPPLSGSISFNGTPLPPNYRNRSNDQLRQIQMIYQMADTALNPRRKIGEIIGRPVEFYRGLTGQAKRRRVEELLAQIELEPSEFIDRYPSEVSGGQKQRIGIARALAAEPKFVICDEVTSALDQLVAEGILRLLTDLQDKMHLSFMLITHDLSTVRAIADEVVVMKDGAVVEAGPKDDMFTPPSRCENEFDIFFCNIFSHSICFVNNATLRWRGSPQFNSSPTFFENLIDKPHSLCGGFHCAGLLHSILIYWWCNFLQMGRARYNWVGPLWIFVSLVRKKHWHKKD
jgi:peptide/nickel transport system ATP-binding protein